MKSFFKKAFELFKSPSTTVIITAYILSVILIISALVILAFDYTGTPLAYLAYALFALSAIALAYSVYITVRFAPRIKASILALLKKNRDINRFLEQYSFRTLTLAALSLVLNVGYSAVFAVSAVMSRSVWYGSLALYYLLLTAMRGGIVFYHGRRRTLSERESERIELAKYRTTGIILSVMPIALSFAIAEMVSGEHGYSYGGFLIYAVAAYTFWKITMSVINLVRVRKNEDVTIKAIRSVGFADSVVSVIALQSAMFNSFSSGGENVALANAITGAAVCALTFILGVFMIINSVRLGNKMKFEENTVE